MTDSFKTVLRSTKVLTGPFPELNTSNLPTTPHETFKSWYTEALTAGVKEPHAMTLSTIDEEGYPDARVLILKNVDARGWHVAIKANSPKGKHLARTPRAALTFYWPLLARQVRVKGEAVLLPREECVEDYLGRPVESRVSAVASRQSQVLNSGEDLEKSLIETRGILEKDPLAGSEKWCVYAVKPESVEFWQGDSSRLHTRIQYVPSEEGEDGWKKQILWP